MQRRYRLLFVDDEPWVLIGLRDIIPWDEYGFEIVACCESAEAALQLLEETTVDAIITDIRMPGMTGLELADCLQERKLVRAFVILSAYRDFEFARQALVTGALYYLVKPLKREEVESVARRLKAHLDTAFQQDRPEEIPRVDLRDEAVLASEAMGHWLALAAPHPCCYVWLGDTLPDGPLDGSAIVTPLDIRAVGRALLVSTEQPPAACDHPGFSMRREGFTNLQDMVREAEASRAFDFAYAKNQTVAGIQRYLAAHYQQRLTIADVAQAFFLSEVYLSELFKKHTGKTVISFIKALRIRQAGRLLHATDLSIQEISEAVGYDDPSYFGRLFKKETGHSPEGYRRRRARGEAPAD